ncbi:MAG: nuclear transport factor 2 family protein [Polyangiaceae bacterium]
MNALGPCRFEWDKQQAVLPYGMPEAVQIAIEKYIQAFGERDPAARAALLEACFAADGRLVTRSREIRGRVALDAEIARFLADPQFLRIRLTSVVDAQRTTFRVRAVVDRRDGSTSAEAFDAGEIDADGRISVILTFAGPLSDNAESSADSTAAG